MPQADLPWTSGIQLQEAPPKGASSQTEPDIRPKRRVWVCRGLCGSDGARPCWCCSPLCFLITLVVLRLLFLVIMFIGQAVEQAEVAKAPDTHCLGLRHAGGLLREHGGGAAWLAGRPMDGWGAWRLGSAWAGALVTSGQRREQKIILKCDPCRWKKTGC